MFAVVGPSHYGAAAVTNEGWGGIESPALKVSIKQIGICDAFNLDDAVTIPLTPTSQLPREARREPNIVDEFGNVRFSISSLVTDDFIDRAKICTDKVEAICTKGTCYYTDLRNVRCIEPRPAGKFHPGRSGTNRTDFALREEESGFEQHDQARHLLHSPVLEDARVHPWSAGFSLRKRAVRITRNFRQSRFWKSQTQVHRFRPPSATTFSSKPESRTTRNDFRSLNKLNREMETTFP